MNLPKLLLSEIERLYLLKRIKFRTFQTYKSHFVALQRYSDAQKWSYIGEAEANQFIEFLILGNKFTGRTVNAYLMSLKTYCKRLIGTKKLKSNPFAKIEFQPEFSEYFRKKELELIDENIDAYSPHFRIVCAMIHACMIRTCEELPQLRIGDITHNTIK